MAQESELALVEAAIDGDTDSFTELCRRYYPAMVAIAAPAHMPNQGVIPKSRNRMPVAYAPSPRKAA